MWEVIARAIPYRGVKNVQQAVMNGERPALPNTCNHMLLDLMQRCWADNILERPSFRNILSALSLLNRKSVFLTDCKPIEQTLNSLESDSFGNPLLADMDKDDSNHFALMRGKSL